MPVNEPDQSGRSRRTLLIVLLASVVVLAAIQEVLPTIIEWVRADTSPSAYRARLVLFAIAAITAVPLVGAAAWLWRTGLRMQETNPDSAHATMPVHDGASGSTGSTARRGRVLQICAGLLLVLAVWAVVLMWRLAKLISEIP
ncbi:MAG: hypothetical protein DIU56_015555 [Pseudomonadota bacterium]|jgi:hypothetical protein|nr:MAG: hypothetical protein DIU56_14475 [Pseudomonadota bacterium]